MDTKMLFFDIDGTLITEEDGKMTDSTREALHLAHKRGHLLFINTGRTKKSLPKELLNMGFDGYICGCGTHIFLRGEELLAARLSNSLCKEVAKEVRSHHVPVFYEASDAIYMDGEMPELEKWEEVARSTFQIEGRDIEEVLASDSLVYDKLLIILKEKETRQALLEYLSRHFVCIDRLHHMYEVVQKDYSKATGIQFICDYLGGKKENCYVFGDSENDRAMLEAVPNSVAMGNAEQAVKDICSYVTTPIREDGIYRAMKHFDLI